MGTMFNSENLRKLIEQTNLTPSQIERDILKVFEEFLSNQTIRCYISIKSNKIANPTADKLELLSKYLTYKLNRAVPIDAFFDIDYKKIK